jgi:glycyl-tRNA synthetase (class II)
LIRDVLESRLISPATTAKDRANYEQILAKLDNFDGQELEDLIQSHKILSPAGNPLTKVESVNLMFQSTIGVFNGSRVFLRPETGTSFIVVYACKLIGEQHKIISLPFLHF